MDIDQTISNIEIYSEKDFYDIVKKSSITEEQLQYYVKKIGKQAWLYIWHYQPLTIDFIEKYKQNVEWKALFCNITITPEIIEKYIDYIPNNIFYNKKYQELAEEFIEKHIDKFDLNRLMVYKSFSEKFLEKHFSKFAWANITFYYKEITEEFIEKHLDKMTYLDWVSVISRKNLSESFIEKHIKKITGKNVLKTIEVFRTICVSRTLSEAFIEKHKNKVDWSNISQCQKMTESFIDKYCDRINWDMLAYNRKVNLSEKLVDKHQDKINWKNLIVDKFSDQFLKKYFNKINWRINYKSLSVVSSLFDDIQIGDKLKNFENLPDFNYTKFLYNDVLFCKVFKNDGSYLILTHYGCKVVLKKSANETIDLNLELSKIIDNNKSKNDTNFESWFDFSPKDCVEMLRSYVGTKYRSIKDSDKNNQISWFTDYLKLMPDFKNDLFYRGMLVSNDFLEAYKAGSVFEIDSITSVSSSKKVARGFCKLGYKNSILMRIKSNKVKHVALNEYEKEGLLLKGTKLLIKDVRKKKLYTEYVLEEIIEPSKVAG